MGRPGRGGRGARHVGSMMIGMELSLPPRRASRQRREMRSRGARPRRSCGATAASSMLCCMLRH